MYDSYSALKSFHTNERSTCIRIELIQTEEIELIQSFKNRIIQIVIQKVATNFTIYTFRLVESYKSFRVRPPLETLRNSSTIFRSSHWRCSIKKDFLKHFVIFTGKHPCWGLFLIMLQTVSPVTLLKRDSNTDIFWWNIGKFVTIPILKNI